MITIARSTQISIKHLKKVHEQTHPAAHLDAPRKAVADDIEDGAEPTEEALLEALNSSSQIWSNFSRDSRGFGASPGA